MRDMTGTEQRLSDLEGYLFNNFHGKHNTTTNHELALHLGYSDIGSAGRPGLANSRRLTADLNALRLAGHPVCCDNTGIFYAKFRTEVWPMVMDYRGRAWKFEKQAEVLQAAAQRLPVGRIAA